MPLELAGLPGATRDGRLRAAISGIIATARRHGARAVVIEDLDFAEARAEGRERTGSRPSRGRRGRGFRRAVAGIPTAKLRDRLVQMTANAGLHVVVVDPAYTSRWGAQHWLAPLQEHHPRRPGITLRRWYSGDAGSATGPGAARQGTSPPRRRRHGQPRRGPGKTRRQDPHPGNPPPHEAPGSHPAPRPGSLTGPRRVTRRARTVRTRRIARPSPTISIRNGACYIAGSCSLRLVRWSW